MKNKFIFYLFIAFFVSACGAQPPDIDEEVLTDNYDWCYTFDFLTETYDLSFVSGQQTASGLETINGVLGVSYEHSQIVQPAYMSANIEIVIPQGTGARNVVSQINIFGIEEFVQANIPNTVTTSISGSPDSAGISGQTSTFSLTTSADTTVSVRNLSVYGNGSNPFPSNDCDDATPTATSTPFELPTFTPTFTPTATVTPTNTPTATPTATATEDLNWCVELLNGLTDKISVITRFDSTPTLTSQAVVGSTNGTNQTRHASMDIVWTGVVNVVNFSVTAVSEYDYDTTGVGSFDVYTGYGASRIAQGSFLSGNGEVSEVTLTASNFSAEGMRVLTVQGSGSYNDPAGVMDIIEVKIVGTGYNPWGFDNCSTPTPTPTNTPPATSTIAPTNTPIVTSTNDGGGGDGGTPNPSASPETNTPVATNTPLPSVTPIATRTPAPQPTFIPTSTPDPNDNNNTYTGDGTCNNYGGSEPSTDSNGNWTEWLFGGINNLVDCTVMPPINFIASMATQTLAAVGSIYDLAANAFAYGQEGMQWVFNQALPYTGAWASNAWSAFSYYALTFTGGLIQSIFGLFQFLYDVVTNIIDFVKNMIDFIFVGFRLVGRIFGLWNNSPATKPPGLPDCINDPMSYDICAIWYILENTFFAGIGAFIIPAFVVGIFIIISFFFLETIVERMQKMWELLSD